MALDDFTLIKLQRSLDKLDNIEELMEALEDGQEMMATLLEALEEKTLVLNTNSLTTDTKSFCTKCGVIEKVCECPESCVMPMLDLHKLLAKSQLVLNTNPERAALVLNTNSKPESS